MHFLPMIIYNPFCSEATDIGGKGNQGPPTNIEQVHVLPDFSPIPETRSSFSLPPAIHQLKTKNRRRVLARDAGY